MLYTFLVLLVSLGWTFGTALVVLSLISSCIPRTWVWSEVRHAKTQVMLAGVGIVLGVTGIFLGIVAVFGWRAIQAGGA